MSRKQGMFAHARYSEKVFRNLPPKIAQGVQRDIAYILKKDNPIDVKKWNRALPSQSDIDNDFQGASANIPRQDSRPLPRRNVKPKPADLRNEFLSAKDLLHKEYHSTEESILPRHRDSYHTTRTEETPTAFKTPENKKRKRVAEEEEDERIFPQNVDPNIIAERIQKGLPHLPLRRNDATTYKDAVTDILHGIISNFIQPSAAQVSIGSSRKTIVVGDNADPMESLMNLTRPLNPSRSFDERNSMENESPLISKELSHIKYSFVNFTYEDDGDILRKFENNASKQQVKEIPKQNDGKVSRQHDKVASSGHVSSISSQYNGFITPEQYVINRPSQYDDDIPDSYDINLLSPFDNNFPEEYDGSVESSLDHSALRTPLSSPSSSLQSQGHLSTLRTPSISETFNNLSNQDLDFGSQHSWEDFAADDFQLSSNPSAFTQSMPASSGFLESTFLRHDPINTTFLQQHPVRDPIESTFVQSQAVRKSTRQSSGLGLQEFSMKRSRKRKVEENHEFDGTFFKF